MRKLFAILLTFCMVFSFVSFAGADEVTITFAFWDNNQEPGMQAIADAYMDLHPDVKVEVQVTPWDQYWTKLEASALGGAMPDVFWMHSNQFFKYVTADTLLPLDFEYDYTPYPAGVTALYTFDDVHYAVPKDYDTIALVYNKEIFDAAGIAYPDDTWTWDTLLETAKKLTDPEKGVYGFGAPNDRQSGYLNLIYQNEGFAFENGKSGYDQAATREAIQWWVDLQKVHQVSPAQESFVDMGVDDQMQAGKLAMCFTGSWMMSSYTNNDRRARPAPASTTAWAMPAPPTPSIRKSSRTSSSSAAPRKPTSCRLKRRPRFPPTPEPSTTLPITSPQSTSHAIRK